MGSRGHCYFSVAGRSNLGRKGLLYLTVHSAVHHGGETKAEGARNIWWWHICNMEVERGMGTSTQLAFLMSYSLGSPHREQSCPQLGWVFRSQLTNQNTLSKTFSEANLSVGLSKAGPSPRRSQILLRWQLMLVTPPGIEY